MTYKHNALEGKQSKTIVSMHLFPVILIKINNFFIMVGSNVVCDLETTKRDFQSAG